MFLPPSAAYLGNVRLAEHQRKLASKRMAAGESTRQIARDFNVSHNAIVRLR